MPTQRWGLVKRAQVVGTYPTRRAALEAAGFATPVTRRKVLGLYEYTSAEGNTATVGTVDELRANGFTL